MTTPKKDIIGIVKELRGQEKNLLLRRWGDDTTVFPRYSGMMQSGTREDKFVIKLRNNYPAIAEALILAVESLERMECDCGNCNGHIASKALSQISSLSVE